MGSGLWGGGRSALLCVSSQSAKTHQLSNIFFTLSLDLKELADLSGQPLWDGQNPPVV